MAQTTQATLSIEGMSCASCVGRVQKALAALEGVSDVNVNLASETARLSVEDAGRLGEAAATLDKLGYPARKASVTLNIASMSCASCRQRLMHGQRAIFPKATLPLKARQKPQPLKALV